MENTERKYLSYLHNSQLRVQRQFRRKTLENRTDENTTLLEVLDLLKQTPAVQVNKLVRYRKETHISI